MLDGAGLKSNHWHAYQEKETFKDRDTGRRAVWGWRRSWGARPQRRTGPPQKVGERREVLPLSFQEEPTLSMPGFQPLVSATGRQYIAVTSSRSVCAHCYLTADGSKKNQYNGPLGCGPGPTKGWDAQGLISKNAVLRGDHRIIETWGAPSLNGWMEESDNSAERLRWEKENLRWGSGSPDRSRPAARARSNGGWGETGGMQGAGGDDRWAETFFFLWERLVTSGEVGGRGTPDWWE